MENKGVQIEVKNNRGEYTPLYPRTVKSQVLNWNIGEIFGPYTFVLKATDWLKNQQTINFNGVTESDKLVCVQVLSCTKEEMIAQDEAYALLNPEKGINSLNNRITFTVDKTPTVDFQVQVWWTR